MAAIRVELELADGQFTTRMLHAGQSIEQFNRAVANSSPELQRLAAAGVPVITNMSNADRSTKSFLSTLRDVSIVVGITSVAFGKLANIQSTWVGDIVKVNAEFERLNYQMRSMSTASNPVKEAGENVAFLRKTALEAPFALATMNNAFVKLKATGTDPLSGSLQSLADGVAAFGGTDDAFNRIVLGISQMSGKGVIQMEELRQQLGESMPTAVALMARSMGISMGQLIKDISTGTVSSKAALKLFYEELDRTYGGRARQMMQTFEGQLKRTNTMMQSLALSAGGLNGEGTYKKGGFMDELRTQLTDLNDALGSKLGASLAESVGAGLAGVVRGIRTTIDTFIEFRSEITRVAMVLTTVFGGMLAGAAISGTFGALSGMLRNAAFGMAQLGNASAVASGYINVATGASLRNGTALLGMRYAAMGAGVAIKGMFVGAAALLPIVTTLGLVAYGAAEYFGLLSDKTLEAYDSLQKYGAESRKEAKRISEEHEADLQRKIDAEETRLMNKGEGLKLDDAGKLIPDDTIGALYLLKTQLAQVRKDAQGLFTDAGDREDEKALGKLQSELDETMRVRKAAYHAGQIVTQDFYDKQVADAATAGKSTTAIDEERGKKLLGAAIELHKGEEALLRDSIDKQKTIIASAADDVAKIQAQKFLDRNQAQLAGVIDQRKMIESQVAGATMIPKGLDDDSKMAKGEKYLTKLIGEIDGLKAGLSGANIEVAELQSLITNGKFGDIDTKGVEELTNRILEAQAAKEDLDKLMKGKKDLEQDVENARIKAIEDRLKLEERASGREMSESERIDARMKAGAYEGYGAAQRTLDQFKLIVGALDVQGQKSNELGINFRDNTFGNATVNKIDTVTDRLRKMAGVITGIGGSLTGLNFDGMGMPGMNNGGGPALPGGNSASFAQAAAKGFLDLIGSAEGTDKGRGYNETLGFGKFTGGDQNLVVMTLDQIDQLQSSMLKHPDNNFNSSALGRYQIVQSTLRDQRKKLGLSGSDQFTPDLQDKVATALAKQRGNDVKGLRFEWEGLRRVDPATIQSAYNNGMNAGKPGPWLGNGGGSQAAGASPAPTPTYDVNSGALAMQQQQLENQNKIAAAIAKTGALEKQNEAGNKRQDVIDMQKDLVAQIQAETDAVNETDNASKNYIATRRILEKKHVDLNSDEAKEALRLAKELDATEAKSGERRKALTTVNNAENRFKERQVELTKRAAEAQARMNDPNELKSSSGYRAMRQELEAYVNDVEAAYGKDTEAYRNAQAYKSEMLAQFNATEGLERAAGWAKSTRDRNNSLMTERQQRAASMQDELAQIDAAVANFQGSEQQKVEFVRQAEAEKASIRAKYNQQMNPMQKQMQEWGDLQGNLTEASTKWMDSLAGGFTDLIMGTGDLKSAINGIIKDLLNMGIKKLISSFMGAKTGATQGGAGAGGGGKKSIMGGGAKAMGGFPAAPMVGLFHTGGIIGRRASSHKAVHPGAFATAPRMHTGGVVGQPKLARGEVPIVAMEGEGVFTPAQMAAMGGARGGNSINQNFNVTANVNASGGTPEQNADLAQQTTRQMKEMVQAVVGEEMQNQSRNGGSLRTR